MGQQQLLILVLAALIAGLAIFGGLNLMKANNQSHERDMIIHRLNVLVGEARTYAAKSSNFGGGDGSLQDYAPPANLTASDGMRIYTTTGQKWILFQGYGTETGNDGQTPVQVIGQYSIVDNKWSTLTVVN